ncbi:MAG: DMT family transporter [Chloroflexota bacterium]
MAWIYVVVAGLFETLMALSLDRAAGFTRLVPSVSFLITGGISFLLLSLSLRDLPVGTAYAIWTGIGAAGTAILGMIILGESRDLPKLLSLAVLIAGIVGLRLTGGH